MTLTNAPAEWQDLRRRVRRLRFELARRKVTTHWAWTVEKGTKTGMIHVHLLQHGDYTPQRLLQTMWGARVDIRAVGDGGAAAGYAMKEAAGRVAGYAMKGAGAGIAAHLALNGGRGCHLSRGYLHGHRSDEVWRLIHPRGVHEWITVPAGAELPQHLHLPPSGDSA